MAKHHCRLINKYTNRFCLSGIIDPQKRPKRKTRNRIRSIYQFVVLRVHQRQILHIWKRNCRLKLTSIKNTNKYTQTIALFTRNVTRTRRRKKQSTIWNLNWNFLAYRAVTHLSYANETNVFRLLWYTLLWFEWKRKTMSPVKLFQTARRSELYWMRRALPWFVMVVCVWYRCDAAAATHRCHSAVAVDGSVALALLVARWLYRIFFSIGFHRNSVCDCDFLETRARWKQEVHSVCVRVRCMRPNTWLVRFRVAFLL